MSSLINIDIFFSLTTYLNSSKALDDNSIYLFYKLNQSRLYIDKYMESLLLVFHYCEELCRFFPYKILF